MNLYLHKKFYCLFLYEFAYSLIDLLFTFFIVYKNLYFRIDLSFTFLFSITLLVFMLN